AADGLRDHPGQGDRRLLGRAGAPGRLARPRHDGPGPRRGSLAGRPGRHARHRDVPGLRVHPRDGLLTPRAHVVPRHRVDVDHTDHPERGRSRRIVASSTRSELTLVGVTPFVEGVALMSYLDVKWLVDFQASDERMIVILLTCVLSVALYASGTFVLALWTLK